MKVLAALALMLVGAAVGIGAALLVMNDDESAEPPATASGADTGEIGTPGCDYEDTSGCVPGAELVVNDGEWLCDEPLAKYARSLGGELPLKVTARFTQPVETVAGVVDLTSGCRGDGTKAIDLVLDIQGDGRTFGGTGDALAVKIKATNIDITGSINCGPRGPGAHQDGIQALGGNDIAFVDLEVGNWEKQQSTCTGASGGIDISVGGVADIVPKNYKCIRCHVVACRRAINIGESVNTRVVDGLFRSANPAEREEPLATGETGLCSFGLSACDTLPEARKLVFERNVCDEYPYESRRR